MLTALLHGIILSFGLILPLGAQNVFVFNQGATQPRLRNALPVIITASLCDTLLILLAVLGVSVIVLTVPVLQTALFSVGIVFLVYMGFTVWQSDTADFSHKQAAMPAKRQIMLAMSVSLLNPHALLDTIGVIGTSSLSYSGPEKAAFTAACIVVSWLWFAGLAIAGRAAGKLDSEGKLLKMVNKVSALIIWIVAVYIAIQLYHTW